MNMTQTSIKKPDRGMAALKKILALAKKRGEGTIGLDLSDPFHTDYLNHVMRAAGRTPERYPALFKRIARRRRAARPHASHAGATALAAAPAAGVGDDPPTSYTDGAYVSFLGALAGTSNTSARAMFTRISKPIKMATITLDVYDANSPNPTSLASGSLNLAADQQTGELITDDMSASPFPTGPNVNLWGMLAWSVEYADKTTEQNTYGSPWSQYAAADPVVTAPVQRAGRSTGDLTRIVIGLSRGTTAADVDYSYFLGQASNFTMMVPFAGSMKFKYNVNKVTGVKFYLALAQGGLAVQGAAYLSSFSVSATDPKTVTYSIIQTSQAPTGGVNFGPSNWDSNTKVYFTGQVLVELKNPGGVPLKGWATVMSTDTPDTDPTDGVAQIKPIMFVWHCVVAGTLITLGDGTTKAIEQIDSGDQVLSGGGVVRPVLATLAQPHWGPVTTLTTAAGASLTCSGTHPIISQSGPVQASSLTVGSVVELATGTDTIASITPAQQNGDILYNLWLDPTLPGPTTMIANLFYTGDYQMQVALGDELGVDPDRLRAATPAHLRVDLESHLEDLGAGC
jgi:hypothetical protein